MDRVLRRCKKFSMIGTRLKSQPLTARPTEYVGFSRTGPARCQPPIFRFELFRRCCLSFITPSLENFEPVLATSADPDSGVLGKLVLNAHTSEPYYAQLKRQITTLIASGDLPAGSNLPSERLLADMLGLSRTTVKRCYNDLRHAQQLSTHGRGGTQVRGTSSPSVAQGRLQDFAAETASRGKPVSRVRTGHAVVQDAAVAAIFERPPTHSFLRLEHIHSIDSQPVAREIAWYDLSRTPAIVTWNGDDSAYGCLRSACGVVLAQAEQSMEAVLGQPEDQRALGISGPTACLLFKRTTHATDGSVVEYVERTVRGDTYVVQTRLVA